MAASRATNDAASSESRPRNSLNVTEAERGRIRELYLDGVRIAEICGRKGRPRAWSASP